MLLSGNKSVTESNSPWQAAPPLNSAKERLYLVADKKYNPCRAVYWLHAPSVGLRPRLLKYDPFRARYQHCCLNAHINSCLGSYNMRFLAALEITAP